MTFVGAERLANSPLTLHKRYSAGDRLSPGEMTKMLHLLPYEEQIEARGAIRTEQAAFWQRWSFFRGGLEYDSAPNFYHVVGCLPVLRQFRNFIDPRQGDLIVDLAGGSAAMAAYFDSSQVAGYVSIDSNPLVQKKAEQHLQRLNYPASHVINHDLTDGLPASLGEIIAVVNPDRVRHISNWGISYFDVDRMTRLIQACLDPDVNRGKPSTLDFNMLTEGKFDPKVLATRFMVEITPQHLVRGQVVPLLRAFRAIPQIIRFGKELPNVAPIWYPEEIEEIFRKRGLEVVRSDSTLLWGQSTAMQVQRKVA